MVSDFNMLVDSRKKRKLEEDQTANYGMETLPYEIVVDILSRLPISSLIRFKYVCRSWKFLAQDPQILNLLDFDKDENNLCLIFHCDFPIRNQLYFVDFPSFKNDNEKEVTHVKKIQAPFSFSMPEFDVVGSSNGLLCLFDSLYNDAIYLYNPFTRNYKELPKTTKYVNQDVVFGFGFNQKTKEFKVIKIVYYKNAYRGSSRVRRYSYQQSNVLIFTLGINSAWKSVGKISYHLVPGPSQILVNGRLHWVALPRRYRPGRSLISFDLADEEFREVPKPETGTLSRCNYHLGVLDGCLCAAVHCNYGKLEIWVMKEYGVESSWVKSFNIGTHMPKGLKQETDQSFRISKITSRGRFVRVLCGLKNGEILLEYKSRALVLFDPQNGKFRDVVFQGMPNWFQTIVHFGSLNMIDGLIDW